MTLIALSIGNIINIRSLTVYKVVSLLLPFLFIYFLIRTKTKLRWNRFFTLMGIFILANLCLFGIISNPHSIRQKLFFIARLSGHGIVMFLLYNFFRGQKTEQINRYLSLIIYVSSSLNILVSIMQIVKNDLLPPFLYARKYLFFSRALGLFMDPNYNGFYVVICIFLLFYLLRYSFIHKAAFLILLIGNLGVLFLTLSFGAFTGIVLTVIIIYFIHNNNKMRILGGIVLLILIGVGIYTLSFIKNYSFEGSAPVTLLDKTVNYLQIKFSHGSFGTRIEQYKISVRAFLKHPLFGIGTVGFLNVDNYMKYGEGMNLLLKPSGGWIIHSNLFAVLAENGLAGFIPYLAIIVFGFIFSWKLYKKADYYIFILAMQIASFIISNAINNLYFNFFWFTTFLPYLMYSCIRDWSPSVYSGFGSIFHRNIHSAN